MPQVARQTRTDRVFLRAKLSAFAEQRTAVRNRDLRDEVREKELERIDREARAAYSTIRAAAEARIADARKEAARMTPAARRRAAIVEAPERFVGLVAAFGHLADGDLPRIAETSSAADDHVVFAALLRSLGDRPDLPTSDAQFIAHAANVVDTELRAQLGDLAVATHELAGLIGEFATRGGGDIELRDVARIAMAARSITIDGLHVSFTDAQLDALYEVAGIARATGSFELPDPVPGVIAPLPAA